MTSIGAHAAQEECSFARDGAGLDLRDTGAGHFCVSDAWSSRAQQARLEQHWFVRGIDMRYTPHFPYFRLFVDVLGR